MNKKRAIAAILPLLILLSRSVSAEVLTTAAETLGSKRMTAYIKANELTILEELGRQQDKKLGLQTDCRTPYRIKVVSFTLLQPVDFPDDKSHPIKGVWRLGYELDRCGEAKRYNTVFAAKDNGEPPTANQYYPGSSNAGPVLIHDAMQSALMQANIQGDVPKDCKNIEVVDMVVTAPPHDVVERSQTYHRVWNETWTFSCCGQTSRVEMTFVPDKTGGGTSFYAKGKPRSADAASTPRDALLDKIEASFTQQQLFSPDSPYIDVLLQSAKTANPGVAGDKWQAVKKDTASAAYKVLMGRGGPMDTFLRQSMTTLSDTELERLSAILGDPVYKKWQQTMASSSTQRQLLQALLANAPKLNSALNEVLVRNGLKEVH